MDWISRVSPGRQALLVLRVLGTSEYPGHVHRLAGWTYAKALESFRERGSLACTRSRRLHGTAKPLGAPSGFEPTGVDWRRATHCRFRWWKSKPWRQWWVFRLG